MARSISTPHGQARIPYNVGTGPGQFSMNLRVSKSIGIGPKLTGTAGAAGNRVVPRPWRRPSRRPRWWTRRRAWSRRSQWQRAAARLDQAATRRYSLNFAAMAHNMLNNVNLAQPSVSWSRRSSANRMRLQEALLLGRIQSQHRPSSLVQFLIRDKADCRYIDI